jgi:hypothetical protein
MFLILPALTETSNSSVAKFALSPESVAVYVIEYEPNLEGVPDRVRVLASKFSPGTSGDSEYV